MFVVTEKSQRPARMNGQCFYCQQKIGNEHKPDCVLIKKKVRVRMIVEYEIEVPATWDKDTVEFSRNESSWCADNALEELEALQERDGCLCHAVEYEHLADTTSAYLDE